MTLAATAIWRRYDIIGMYLLNLAEYLQGVSYACGRL